MPENAIFRRMIKENPRFLKRRIAIFFTIVLISTQSLFAQIPNWDVNESEYQYTMTIVAKLNVDGKQLINQNDRVAAFVGTVCRGLSGLTYVASKKSYYAYLTIFSNKQGETISFKLYDNATNKITTVSKTLTYVINEHKGNLFQSYSIAEPSLNNMADILSFNFMGVPSLSSIISNNNVSINISESFPLNPLKPVFTLSKGASLFENRVFQKSGEDIKNFSTIIAYEVLSEDESTLKNYSVEVKQSIDPPLFYKKDAVCYAGGVIKVVSKREGNTVQITRDGKAMASKRIVNGEALFPDLTTGTYVATIGNDWKIITIKLKVK